VEIHFVTSNKDKLEEFEDILGFKLKRVNLELDEIQAVEVKKVTKHKTRQAFGKVKRPVICEDTGLYFEEWGGLPGALAKLFGEKIGYDKLCKVLKGSRRAKAQTVIGFFDGRNYKSFIGEIRGKITKTPKGENGFGWDTIFIPQGHRKTFAQMDFGEKNKISMRKIALEKFKKFLKQQNAPKKHFRRKSY